MAAAGGAGSSIYQTQPYAKYIRLSQIYNIIHRSIHSCLLHSVHCYCGIASGLVGAGITSKYFCLRLQHPAYTMYSYLCEVETPQPENVTTCIEIE